MGVLHTSFFCNIASEKQDHLSPTCSSLNFVLADTSITSSTLPKLSHGWHLYRLQRGGHVSGQDLGRMVEKQCEFLFRTQITIIRRFHSPQGMREKYVLFRGAAVARSTFKIYRKTEDIFCWFWLNYIKCRKTFWVNLVLWLTTWKFYNGWGLHGIQVHPGGPPACNAV